MTLLHESSHDLQPRSGEVEEKVLAIREQYGTKENILTLFNPSNTLRYTEDERRCYLGSAPTLTLLNLTYGRNTAAMWITAQLNDLNKMSGASHGMTEEQMENTAHLLAREGCYLKLTEWMLFFYGLRTQKYAHFYGSVDPDKILQSLNMFKKERASRLERYEQEAKAMEREQWKDKAITWEEYCRLEGINKKNPLDRIQ